MISLTSVENTVIDVSLHAQFGFGEILEHCNAVYI